MGAMDERAFGLLQLSSWAGGWYEIIQSGPTGMQDYMSHVWDEREVMKVTESGERRR